MIKNIRLKYLIVGVLSTLFLFNSCSNKNAVSIKGIITSSKDAKIYLDRLDFSKSAVLDSTDVSKGDDNFRFKVKSVTEPTFFILRISGKGAITLLAEPGEKIQLVVKDNNINDYIVSGSKGSLLTKQLTLKLNSTKSLLVSLEQKYKLALDPYIKSGIESEYAAAVDSQRAFSSKFIWANAMSRASVMALYQKFNENSYVFDRADDIKLFKAVASSLRAIYPNSDYTKGILDDIKKMDNLIKNQKLSNLIKQIEPSLPEIALPNSSGEIVRLSRLSGKVILLSFWASWDQNSLMDNHELLEIYRQYKGKGFEIYQVSLDTNRDEWINAIESAGLPWINVCELNPKGSSTALLYNVSQIPANYLIDKKFDIIGKNLYGESLKNKLRELF